MAALRWMRFDGGYWTRFDGGHEAVEARIFDNGAGFGPAKGGGRWAVEVAGGWLANVATLAEAKELARVTLEAGS